MENLFVRQGVREEPTHGPHGTTVGLTPNHYRQHLAEHLPDEEMAADRTQSGLMIAFWVSIEVSNRAVMELALKMCIIVPA